ncbi:MAG: hypothetical protein ACYCOU_16440 [Sulfobacillus sp.]
MKTIVNVWDHARSRMAERGITMDEAETVLNNHHTDLPGKGGTRKLVGTVGGREIQIFVREVSPEAYELRSVMERK